YKVVAKKDQRLVENNNTDVVSSTTIAAIVTSLGGPPAAIGIIRLSSPNAVLAVPMLAPISYTREDVVELQCHGSE
ncbi:hypothetical protein RYX36_016411, partial [Vicia faba]